MDRSKGCSFTAESEWEQERGLRSGALFSTHNFILLFLIINRELDNSYSRPPERAQAELGSPYSWCLTALHTMANNFGLLQRKNHSPLFQLMSV